MVFTLCTEFVNSPYIEPTASGLPNPTPVEGEVRFIQAPDQSVVSRRTPRQATMHLSRRASVNNGVLTHSLDVDLKIFTSFLQSFIHKPFAAIFCFRMTLAISGTMKHFHPCMYH